MGQLRLAWRVGKECEPPTLGAGVTEEHIRSAQRRWLEAKQLQRGEAPPPPEEPPHEQGAAQGD